MFEAKNQSKRTASSVVDFFGFPTHSTYRGKTCSLSVPSLPPLHHGSHQTVTPRTSEVVLIGCATCIAVCCPQVKVSDDDVLLRKSLTLFILFASEARVREAEPSVQHSKKALLVNVAEKQPGWRNPIPVFGHPHTTLCTQSYCFILSRAVSCHRVALSCHFSFRLREKTTVEGNVFCAHGRTRPVES